MVSEDVAMDSASFDLGEYVEVVENLDTGTLYRVVRREGHFRDVRRVSDITGGLDGVEVRYLAAELLAARSAVLRRHTALRVRFAGAQWRQAVEADDEDVDTLDELAAAAEMLSDLVLDEAAPRTGAIDECPATRVSMPGGGTLTDLAERSAVVLGDVLAARVGGGR
jgi:hypothetical protein